MVFCNQGGRPRILSEETPGVWFFDVSDFKTENPVPNFPRSWYEVVGFVRDEGDGMLNERVRRAVELPQSEEPRRFAPGWMLSIIFAYLERRFLRGLGCERERKNDLNGFGVGAPWDHVKPHLSR